MGADEVIPDEFGSSVEVLARVLKKYQTPTEDVQKIISQVRVDGYEMIRLMYQESVTLKDFQITFPDLAIDTIKVAVGAHVANKTLSEIALRKNHELTALLIKRGEETFSSIHGETSLLPHDVVVLLGTQEKLSKASPLFKTPNL
jgi:CPA2 family monovalent cation:H+ antiporter-2